MKWDALDYGMAGENIIQFKHDKLHLLVYYVKLPQHKFACKLLFHTSIICL